MSNGIVIYDGPSMWDGQPIVAIATGIEKPSANAKTGPMIQVWIIRADVSPVDASASGEDESICGDCPARRSLGGHCYVTLHQGPLSVYRAHRRGAYATACDENAIASVGEGRRVRLGAYGDPAMVPIYVWRALLSRSAGHTGYTHQWDKPIAEYLRTVVMASCDSAEEAQNARDAGWRYFRVASDGTPMDREVECLSDSRGMSCHDCGLCDGVRDNGAGKSVRITVHGSLGSRFAKILNVVQ